MAFIKGENSVTEIPFSCEWNFFDHMFYNFQEVFGTSFYEYMKYKVYGDGNINGCDRFYMSTRHHSLPVLPGIKFYLSAEISRQDNWNDDHEILLQLNIESNYLNYDINVKFETKNTKYCKDINHKDDNGHAVFNISDDYEFNQDHLGERMTFWVNGKFVVKHVGALPVFIKVSDKNMDLFDQNETKDFVIAAEGKETRVHKKVLIQASTVFATMLESDRWKETMEKRIVIPDFSYKIIEIAINSYYGQEYEEPLHKEDYLMLYQFADKYDMKKLKRAAVKCLVLTPQNVIEFANFFHQEFCDELVNCCIDYILACSAYSIVVKDDKLLNVQIYSMFYNRTLVSPVIKRDQDLEHNSLDAEISDHENFDSDMDE